MLMCYQQRRLRNNGVKLGFSPILYITIFTFDFYFISALFPQHFDDSFSSRPVSRHFKAKLHIELNPKQLQLVLNLILKYVIS